MKYKIVSDSSANIYKMSESEFAYAPLKIVVGDRTFVDNTELDLVDMINALKEHKGPSRTSCPNVSDWMEAFEGGDIIYVVTMTSNLSGTYNAAALAKNQYEEEHPEAKVYVMDSLSTGPEMELLLEKMKELVQEEKTFEEAVEILKNYQKETHLLFSLESLDNLAKNGRVNPLVAKAAGVLGVRVVAKASDEGTIEQLHKCRGEKKAVSTLYKEMKEHGYKGGKVRLAHIYNDGIADALEGMIRADYPDADVQRRQCGALCTFYAEKGGMLVGFEG